MVGPKKVRLTDAEKRERHIVAARAEAQALLVQIALYVDNDIPCDASWGDIEFQGDVNRRLRELRDHVLGLGEYARPAAPRETNASGDKSPETNRQETN